MPVNPDFSLPGATPSEAIGWTRTTEAAGLYASFASEGEVRSASEVFTWFTLLTELIPVEVQWDARTGTPKAQEDFEDLWGARHARLLSGKEAPFILQPGQTLLLRVNGGDVRTVTFDMRDFANIADARAEEVARVIDRAIADADAFMAPGGRGVMIATTAQGYETTLEVTGGTAASTFGFMPVPPAPAGEPANVARGSDEEGGTFFRRAEFDMMNIAPSNAEFEDFVRGYIDPSVAAVVPANTAPDLRYDPFDKLTRFVFGTLEPFLPSAFIATLDTYTFAPSEGFDAAGFPSETLTTNYL